MNTHSQPLVSLLLSVYNVGHYLPQALDSILSQKYENFEVIAIDDFSRDDSWKILKIYRKFDKRIKIYRNVKHYGKGITLNRALVKAKGSYLCMMDAKDMLYKDKLKKQVKFLETHPKTVAVGTQCTLTNQDAKKIGLTDFPQTYDAIYHKPLHTISINFETVMINTLLLPKDVFRFDASEKDMLYSDVLVKLIQYGEISNLPFYLQYKRVQDTSKTATLKQIPSLFKLWIKSINTYDYKPSLRSFFSSAFKSPTLSTQ